MSTDLRLAFRRVLQSPGYAATGVLTFALAIGANSAIFSAVNTVLLRPLPVAAPENLAVVWQTDEGGQAVVELTYRHLREWTASDQIFTRAAVMGSHNWSAVVEGRGEPSRIWFSGVSAAFFDTLGVAPFLGRAFRPEDDVPNAPLVAVLNHETWRRRFGGDPAVIGSRMILDGDAVEIVGVMPPGFDFPRGAEFWLPAVASLVSGARPDASVLETVGVFYVVGRVRSDVDPDALRSEIDRLEARLDAAQPGRPKWGETAVVRPLVDHVFGRVRPALRVLWAAVAVLLLIACANVSGLILTRISRRRHEDGVRLALGATRGAIARLWTIEAMLIATAGGTLGLIIAQWIARAIVKLAPDDLPRVADITIDSTVALFTLAVVLVAALVTSAAPLRQVGRTHLATAFESERTTTSRGTRRVRSTLLVVQIGLSVVLLVAAGLVVRSFMALRHIDLGFTPDRVLGLTVEPGNPNRPPNEWLREFLTRVRALPGVEAAGAVYLRPLRLGPIGSGVRVVLEGQPETEATLNGNPTLNHLVATPEYFGTLRIALRAGRLFTDRDTAGAPRVVLVSESTARRLWPGQNAIGKRMKMALFTSGRSGREWRTVVGVVSDVRYRGLDEVQLDIYDPALQVSRAADDILVRATADPLGLVDPIRAIAREMDPTSIVDAVTTMDAVVGRAEAPWRLTMWMFVLFAALAFGLAALGLFSVVALEVTHRGREFAIRMALGASHGGIVRTVVTRAAWLVLVGLMLGLGTSMAGSRAIEGLLFSIAPDDGMTYAAVVALVLVVVAMAAYVPARRAAGAQPQELLREQ